MSLAAPSAGFGGSLGSARALPSLTLGGLLWLSRLLRRGLCGGGGGGLLGGAVWRRRLDLGRGGGRHYLLLDDLLLDHLRRRRPGGNHLHLSRSGRGRLGQRPGRDLNLKRERA